VLLQLTLKVGFVVVHMNLENYVGSPHLQSKIISSPTAKMQANDIGISSSSFAVDENNPQTVNLYFII
jgi:hypothetical protein